MLKARGWAMPKARGWAMLKARGWAMPKAGVGLYDGKSHNRRTLQGKKNDFMVVSLNARLASALRSFATGRVKAKRIYHILW